MSVNGMLLAGMPTSKQLQKILEISAIKMKKAFLIISIISIATCPALVKAQESGFQASLTPQIAIEPTTTEIDGVALSIWGENPQHAFALGFVNGSTGDSSGFSLGLVNVADTYTGVAFGIVNISEQDFHGWQDGLVNYCQGSFNGFQSGWINVSSEFHGLQYGFVNYTENLRGVQIGLVNVALNNPWFDEFPNKLATGFPIVNWSF
jgi:hypothetical protein